MVADVIGERKSVIYKRSDITYLKLGYKIIE